MAGFYSYWGANAGVPVVAYAINFFARLKKGLPITAGADWALILLSFDVVGLLDPEDVLRHIFNKGAAEYAPVALAGLAAAGLFIWLANLLYLEDSFEKAQATGWTIGTIVSVISSIALTGSYVYAHYLFIKG